MKEPEYLSNWNHMKLLVQAKWSKLDTRSLETMQPTVENLVDLIHEAYPKQSRETILSEVKNLYHQVPQKPAEPGD